jgi:uncharacterized OsmC-like protein
VERFVAENLYSLALGADVHLLRPEGESRARGWILMAPGSPRDGASLPPPTLPQMLAEGGLGVVLPAEPLAAGTLVALAREMGTRWGAPDGIVGLADGAAAALEASQRLASVRVVATVGAVRAVTAQLVAAATPPQSALLEAADHFFLREGDEVGAAMFVLAWADRHLVSRVASPQPTAWTGSTGYRTRVGVRDHRLWSDEPVSLGGTDLGPTPFELVWAGLAACTTITLRMYADRKGWPLEDIGVRIEPVREGRDIRARRILSLRGDLDAEQRDRLAEIADRCPVHRALEHGVPVTTERDEPEPAV